MTAATGKPRGRKPGSPKTGGRVAGGRSLDKQARSLVSASLAGSILETFERMGGPDDMLEWATQNKTVFYTQILSRLMPAPQKDDDSGGGTYNQFNINNISDRDAAMRIAFVLNSAVHGNPAIATEPATIEAKRVPDLPEGYITPPRWRPPADAPDMLEPVEDPERERWASELPLSDEQRRDSSLIRQTKEASIVNYAGSSAEQGGGTPGNKPERDPRSAQRDRMLKRNSLL